MNIFFITIGLFCFSLGFAQNLDQFNKFESNPNTITTNAVSNMIFYNGHIWYGNDYGLAKIENNSFNTVSTGNELLDTRNIYSLSAKNNHLLFSIGETRVVDNKSIPKAMGFGFSEDGGNQWNYIPFPLDNPDKKTIDYGNLTLNYLPIIVPEQSVAYDTDISGDTLFIAAFASGIMYSPDKGQHWNRYILPPDFKDYISPDSAYQFVYDPRLENNLNLRGFSIHKTKQGILFAGTAGGINVRYQPLGWIKYKSQPNNDKTIPGNWVTGIKSQIISGVERVWAVCWKSIFNYEEEGLAFSDDYGKTWTRTLLGERIYDLEFKGDTIVAVGRNGVYYTNDNTHWSFKNIFFDPVSQNNISFSQFYSVAFNPSEKKWYIGSSSGLLASSNEDIFRESSWAIHRINSRNYADKNTFAYPNPFSPDDDGIVRVSFPEGTDAILSIFSYDMLLIKTIKSNFYFSHEISWDGRDAFGNRLSNGVYFYSVKSNNSEYWGKILILE